MNSSFVRSAASSASLSRWISSWRSRTASSASRSDTATSLTSRTLPRNASEFRSPTPIERATEARDTIGAAIRRPITKVTVSDRDGAQHADAHQPRRLQGGGLHDPGRDREADAPVAEFRALVRGERVPALDRQGAIPAFGRLLIHSAGSRCWRIRSSNESGRTSAVRT